MRNIWWCPTAAILCGVATLAIRTADIHLSSEESSDSKCSSEADCLSHADCLNCTKPSDCQYGSMATMECRYKDTCRMSQQHQDTLKRQFLCRFCFQTNEWEHNCAPVTNCSVTAAQRMVKTVCSVNPGVICLGNEKFYKMAPCNWASGYRWSTAFLLSVTLGGFGADRFYLGLWREGLGKVFSFGGLGVWTIVDVILIGTGYIGPADGSVYM